MADIATRNSQNPILRPADLAPSVSGMEIACLLNPGIFRFNGKVWMLVRVAERPQPEEGMLLIPVLSGEEIEIMRLKTDAPGLDTSDPRVIRYNGKDYLTTLSHLRLLCSDDGTHFYEPPQETSLRGAGQFENYGIEDCRVATLGNTWYLTYTAVSPYGVGVGLMSTTDWSSFDRKGLILPPHNKDCALFEQQIGGWYYMLHRPSSVFLGGNYIWLARSLDLSHWGDHVCIAQTREGKWDSERIGAGASPILTSAGWLEVYHGADKDQRYCLGALLLDRENPAKVLARSEEPIMEPLAGYEQTGFFGNVVFTNGHLVSGDRLQIYYGASDEVICSADFSIREILNTLS